MTPSASPPLSAFPRKSAFTIATHWLSAFAILLAYGLVWTREVLDDETLRSLVLTMHRQMGMAVLILLVLRLQGRIFAVTGTSEPGQGSRWQTWMATASHIALYGLLLAMPVLGWALTNAQGHEVTVFQIFRLPLLLATDPDLADDLQDWHELLSWCLLGLVVLHFSAALWHHFFRRDGVLASMLPIVDRQRFDRSVP